MSLPAEPVPVRADAAEISRAIESVLDNAIQHGGPGSPVSVRVDAEGNMARCRVSDRGPGAAPQILARAFEPFFTMKRGGTGLGLSLVRHVVEHHGGSATLRNNEPPPGCTAELLLPLADLPPTTEAV